MFVRQVQTTRGNKSFGGEMENLREVNERVRKSGALRPRAKLNDHEANLINELVVSLRTGGMRPMDVYRAIAEGLRRGAPNR